MQPKIVFLIVVCVSLLFLLLGVVGFWLHSRPQWQLTTANTATGVMVTLTNTDSPAPIYTVHIKGDSIRVPISHLLRTQVRSPDVTTLFYDETVPPGRWTLKVNRTKVDIMPARIIVDDEAEGDPGSHLEIESRERHQ
jgi:hypothetical protein